MNLQPMNKYHNKKIEVDGIIFDSKKEANRYIELKTLERVGKIHDLQLQVKFRLIPPQYASHDGVKKGKCLERGCSYVADFVYYQYGVKVVEDTKGKKTNDYIIKRKLMLYMHNIRIKEV